MDEGGNYCVSTIHNTIGKQRLNLVQWIEVAKQVIEGVMHLHDIGILHNDLKSNNVILVPPSHGVKIIDFGKARSTTGPRVYNLTKEQKKVYNTKHGTWQKK